MNIAVVSYSLTGNNEALAGSITKELPAEHIKILEAKPRTIGSIILDVILNRTPQVQPIPSVLDKYDLILFVGPVWMGLVATPLRAYFKYLRTDLRKYAFISISGGADGNNPKLAGELKKMVGTEPVFVMDFHIADMLPSEPKPTRKITSAYKINSEEIRVLTNSIIKITRENI